VTAALRRFLLCGGVLLAGAAPARAQVWVSGGGDAPRRGSWEISAGALMAQGFDVGDRTATLTRNPSTGAGSFDLFTTSTRLVPAPAAQGRVGVYLSRSLSIEGGVQYSRPQLRARLTNDVEGADSITASSTITRYVFDGSLVVHLVPLAFAGGRGIPFVLGGGGYVRELHEGNELLETGQEFHGGGGVKFWFGRGKHRAGVRVEAGLAVREGGFDFEDGRRTTPTAGVAFMYLF
jgi:hypothetical protein